MTRERLQEIIARIEMFGHGAGYTADEVYELARMALAALDSEPVAVVPDIDRKAIADKVYGKCCRIPGATFYNAAEFAIDEMEACRPAPQQPVVPDERAAFNAWNNDVDCPLAGRDAKSAAWMAWQARAELAGNSPVIPGAEQRIADAVELLKQAAPAMLADNSGPDGPLAGRLKSPVIPEGYVMVPKEPTEDMLQASYREAAVYSPTAYRAMIAAAPQEVQGE